MIRKLSIRLYLVTLFAYIAYYFFFEESYLPAIVNQITNEQMHATYVGVDGKFLTFWYIVFFIVLVVNIKKLWTNANDALYWTIVAIIMGYLPDFVLNQLNANSGWGFNLQLLSELFYGSAVSAYLVERYEWKKDA